MWNFFGNVLLGDRHIDKSQKPESANQGDRDKSQKKFDNFHVFGVLYGYDMGLRQLLKRLPL